MIVSAYLSWTPSSRIQPGEFNVCSPDGYQTHDEVPDALRLFDEFTYKAGSWPRSWRVAMKAEVMALGENRRFIVTSLPGLDAQIQYEDIYCARGQAENFIKHLKTDLACDRTSCTSFMANCMRSPNVCLPAVQPGCRTRPDPASCGLPRIDHPTNHHQPSYLFIFSCSIGLGVLSPDTARLTSTALPCTRLGRFVRFVKRSG